MGSANIYFEAGGDYIAAEVKGRLAIRCNFEFTDCGESEPLDVFSCRHGGNLKTVEYLKECYSENVRIK